MPKTKILLQCDSSLMLFHIGNPSSFFARESRKRIKSHNNKIEANKLYTQYNSVLEP